MVIRDIKRTSVAEEVFKVLHDQIVAGELKPGDKLPPQDKLAKQFNVSRNTIREAVYKLTVMGFLSAKQGVGTIVQVTNPSGYVTSLSSHLLFNPATVREFIEARLIVEQATARLAGIRATQDEIRKLKDIIDQQKEALEKGDLDSLVRLGADFHTEVARASGNNVLLKFLEAIWDLLHQFIGEVSHLPGANESSIKYHTEIYETIRARDTKKAEAKIREHMHNVIKRIENNLGLDLDLDLFLTTDSPGEKGADGYAHDAGDAVS